MSSNCFTMLDIPPPPTINTGRISTINSDQRETLLHVIKVNKFLSNRFNEIQEYLDATEAVMQTSLYKNSNRFRSDKAFKGLKMVQRTLQRLKDLRLQKVIKRFSDVMPLPIDIKATSRDLYLPVDSILQHLLCTIFQASIFSERLIGLCEHTKKYLLARIQLGHFWNWAVFSFANISRIWTLSQTLVVNLHLSYDVYNKLLEHLPHSDIRWLPEAIKLTQEVIPANSALREKETIKKLLESNDFPTLDIEQPKDNFSEIGEVIERPVVSKSKATTISKKQWLKLNDAISKLSQFDDIKTFIKSETEQRQKCRKEALTKKMEQKEWKALKSQVKTQLSKDVSVSQMCQILFYFIICPEHQGTNCKDVKEVELKFR